MKKDMDDGALRCLDPSAPLHRIDTLVSILESTIRVDPLLLATT